MADAAAEAVTSDSGLLDWLTGGSATSSIALLLCVLFGAYAAYIITNEPERDGTRPSSTRTTTRSRRAILQQSNSESSTARTRTRRCMSPSRATCLMFPKLDRSTGPAVATLYLPAGTASKCLATMSLEEVDLDQPIDGLNHGEREHLDEWHLS